MSDTSPLRMLQAISLVSLLSDLYQEVLVPPAVVRELAVPVPGLGPLCAAEYTFLTVRAPADAARVEILSNQVNDGEAEALALALEVKAEIVLIDEADGRKLAADLGLRTTGVLALLVHAKRAGLIDSIAPLLDTLDKRISFRVSPTVRDRILRDAGEMP